MLLPFRGEGDSMLMGRFLQASVEIGGLRGELPETVAESVGIRSFVLHDVDHQVDVLCRER